MVSFPCCKINLGLHVVSKRPDGYHNIETCFYPVTWTDLLEIIPSDSTRFTFSGIKVTENAEENLCVLACRLLQRECNVPSLQLHLHKILPMGAGLGGGSSDAAATLMLLNHVFDLDLDPQQLHGYASQLGSDVPFFLDPQPMLGEGKGEILTPSSLSLKGMFLVLVCPAIHSSTVEAYREVIARPPALTLKDILSGPVSEWKDTLTNDFEPFVFVRYPLLDELREKLYRLGASYAGMSGSGSAIFGLFDKPFDAAGNFQGIRVWSAVLAQ